jgi:hypothetical protein
MHFHFMKIHRLLSSLQRQNIFRQDLDIGNGSGRFGAVNLIQPTISLEMPVPSQGHCGFHSFPVVN